MIPARYSASSQKDTSQITCFKQLNPNNKRVDQEKITMPERDATLPRTSAQEFRMLLVIYFSFAYILILNFLRKMKSQNEMAKQWLKHIPKKKKVKTYE